MRLPTISGKYKAWGYAGIKPSRIKMSCKWRTNLAATTKRSIHILASCPLSRFFPTINPPGFIPSGFVLLASIGAASMVGVPLSPWGCGRAQAEFRPVSTEPDMSRRGDDADYSAGCSTVGCHQQLTETKWVHAPAATGACSMCHLAFGQPGAHQFAIIDVNGSSCAACHAFDGAPPESIHEPFALGACQDCHDPHGGDRKSLMIAQTTQDLCASCHDPVAHKFPHRPIAQGDCLTCHDPHQSAHKKLLVQRKETLCLGCHQGMDHGGVLGAFSDESNPAFVHEPVLEDGCVACHAPHGSNHRGLLNQTQRSTCLDCHQGLVDDLPLAQSIHGAFESTQACTQCHSPHASDFSGLLAEPFNTLCLTCHDQTIESFAGKVLPNMKKLIEESPMVHQPAARGECVSCHNPHFSAEHALLRSSYPDKEYASFDPQNYAMCTACHDSILFEEETTTHTGFRDGEVNLHFVHVNREKGRACGLCHQPHAGALPKLMREAVPFGPGGWNLPINFIFSDTGGSCMSACHEPRSYDRTLSLQLFPE